MSVKKILVVEDEKIVAWDIQTILEEFGYQVPAIVSSGAKAIEKVAETHPDLVLMDIRIQGDMDGVEAAEKIRINFNIPIVYLTAHADEATLKRARLTEPFGYIIKPFQEKELNATIEMALYKDKIEKFLHAEKQWFSTVLKSIGDAVIVTDSGGLIKFMNPHAETLTGWKGEEAVGLKASQVLSIINPERSVVTEKFIAHTIQQGIPIRLADNWTLRTKQGTEILISDSAAPIKDDQGEIEGVVVVFQDVTERKQAEESFRQQSERERLIMTITQRIRQSLNLKEILNTTVAEVREFLQTDRVLIFRLQPDGSGVVTVESVAPGWIPVLGSTIHDPCFNENYAVAYQQGRIQSVADIYTANLATCHVDLLSQLQVRANLVVPILQGENLWGLLIAQHCSEARQWQPLEISLLKQLADQLAIAIQQSELYQQVQQLNSQLEHQVQERTAQLQQSVDFEARLKRITDKVRDSLDENQILQTVVQELGDVLGVNGCNTALYNADKTTATILYEYTSARITAPGRTVNMTELPEIYRQLLQGQYFRFCNVIRNPSQKSAAILACPIFDDQGALGDLWLFKEENGFFNELEMRLVQQVANQCAIAIRQARLYQQAQAQVTALEKLNQLKDDFLCTVSHELRTPMSNIYMAIQMLELTMKPEVQASHPERYVQILREECEREVNLINNLLELQQLEAGNESLVLTTIQIQSWLPHILETFEVRLRNQQQSLHVDIDSELPPVASDLSKLGRILRELLDNACKYTPSGGQITVIARSTADRVQLSISNSGVQIPASEIPHIFEKFYRIPSNDPWKHGGTGLGLALVKKLMEDLGGSIQVESNSEQTTFIVSLPLQSD